MLWPLIAASAGAVGLNYQATKDLDGSGQKRTLPFWPAFALGAVTGLWIGVSFGSHISSGFGFVEKWFGVLTPAPEDETSSDEEEKNRKRKKSKKQ